MSFTAPYGQHHYVGEFAGDIAATAGVVTLGWDAAGSPQEGQCYFDSTGGVKALKIWNGTAWQALASGVSNSMPGLSNVWIVDKGTVTGSEDGSVQNPYHNIQDGINAASSGDTVLCYSGTYSEQIALKAGVTVVGIDRDRCIVTADVDAVVDVAAVDTGMVDFTITRSAAGVRGVRGRAGGGVVTFRNVKIVETGNQNTDGVDLESGGAEWRFDNCVFQNIQGDCVHIDFIGTADFRNCQYNGGNVNVLNIATGVDTGLRMADCTFGNSKGTQLSVLDLAAGAGQVIAVENAFFSTGRGNAGCVNITADGVITISDSRFRSGSGASTCIDVTASCTLSVTGSRFTTTSGAADIRSSVALTATLIGNDYDNGIDANITLAEPTIGALGAAHGTCFLGLLAADPSAVAEGYFWYNTTDQALRYRDATGTRTLSFGVLNSFPGLQQTIWVTKGTVTGSEDGSVQNPWHTVAQAITQANGLAPSTSNRIGIIVTPGIYVEALTPTDSFVDIIGFDRDTTIIEQTSGSANVLNLTKINVRIKGITFRTSGTATGAAAAIGRDGSGGLMEFEQCAFRNDNAANTTQPLYFYHSRTGSQRRFRDCYMYNANAAVHAVYFTSGSSAYDVDFYNCTSEGGVNIDSIYPKIRWYGGKITANMSGQGTIRCESWGQKFYGVRVVNEHVDGYAFLGNGILEDIGFFGCTVEGGANVYDIHGNNVIKGQFETCDCTVGLSGSVYVLSRIKHVAATSGPFYKTLNQAMQSFDSAAGPDHYILHEDQTGPVSPKNSHKGVIDGQGIYSLANAGGLILSGFSTGDIIKFVDITLDGQISIGSDAKCIFDRVYLTGQVDYIGTAADATLIAHDSRLEGDATFNSPIRFRAALGRCILSQSYAKGLAGSGALEWGTDGTSTTYAFNGVRCEFSKIYHGDLGANNPFEGLGLGASPPTIQYAAHGGSFNIEPTIAAPADCTNTIDPLQRFNTIDPDGDFYWLEDWF